MSGKSKFSAHANHLIWNADAPRAAALAVLTQAVAVAGAGQDELPAAYVVARGQHVAAPVAAAGLPGAGQDGPVARPAPVQSAAVSLRVRPVVAAFRGFL